MKWPLLPNRSLKSDKLIDRELPNGLQLTLTLLGLNSASWLLIWHEQQWLQKVGCGKAPTDPSRSWQGRAWILSFHWRSSNLLICVKPHEDLLANRCVCSSNCFLILLSSVMEDPIPRKSMTFIMLSVVLYLWLNSVIMGMGSTNNLIWLVFFFKVKWQKLQFAYCVCPS